MVRDAALVAGASLEQLVRAHAARRVPRPLLLGAGLAATGAALALVHLSGTDVSTWTASGQAGRVPGLFDAFSGPDTPAEAA
jgi:hypothetical protein